MTVKVKDGDIEEAIRKFRKESIPIIKQWKIDSAFESKPEERKRKSRINKRRMRKAQKRIERQRAMR